MGKLQQFFSNLASRMTDENDLSDFVWALCQSNEGFKGFFLDFFFPNEKLKASEVSIEREVSLEGGRPDFVITRIGDDEDRFFVEVKKWDRNHHFMQYLKELKKDGHDIRRLAYITQYTLEPSGLKNADRNVAWIGNKWACQVRTWGEFLWELHSNMKKPWAATADVQGLYAFVKASCPNFEAVTSFVAEKDRIDKIKNFVTALDTVVQEELIFGDGQKMQLKGYYGKHDYEYSLGYIGRYFSITGFIGGGDPVWAWLGSYFTEEDGPTGLTLEFENLNGWAAPIFKLLKSNKPTLDYSFPLNLMADEESMKVQIRTALLAMLADCKAGKLPQSTSYSSPDEFQDVKRIQLFIDQNVFVNKGDIPVEFSTDKVPNDDFSADRWIGRYSHVFIGGKMRLVWLGVCYDGKKLLRYKGGETIMADGSQLVLEFDDTRYVICEDPNWNAIGIRKMLYVILRDAKD